MFPRGTSECKSAAHEEIDSAASRTSIGKSGAQGYRYTQPEKKVCSRCDRVGRLRLLRLGASGRTGGALGEDVYRQAWTPRGERGPAAGPRSRCLAFLESEPARRRPPTKERRRRAAGDYTKVTRVYRRQLRLPRQWGARGLHAEVRPGDLRTVCAVIRNLRKWTSAFERPPGPFKPTLLEQSGSEFHCLGKGPRSLKQQTPTESLYTKHSEASSSNGDYNSSGWSTTYRLAAAFWACNMLYRVRDSVWWPAAIGIFFFVHVETRDTSSHDPDANLSDSPRVGRCECGDLAGKRGRTSARPYAPGDLEEHSLTGSVVSVGLSPGSRCRRVQEGRSKRRRGRSGKGATRAGVHELRRQPLLRVTGPSRASSPVAST